MSMCNVSCLARALGFMLVPDKVEYRVLYITPHAHNPQTHFTPATHARARDWSVVTSNTIHTPRRPASVGPRGAWGASHSSLDACNVGKLPAWTCVIPC